MSNNDLVSVPREHELKIRQTPLADLLSGLKTGEIRDCSDREFAVGDTVLLREIDDARDYTGTVLRRTITHVQKNFGLPDHLCVLSYGQPAEQHQGEPIGYVCPRALDAAINGRIGAEQISILKTPYLYINQPLYTHADPGEVESTPECFCVEHGLHIESLQRRIQNADLALKAQTQNCDTLRAQLASANADKEAYAQNAIDLRSQLDEAHALLRELRDSNGYLDQEEYERINALLSASAELGAPTSCTWTYNEDSFVWDTTCSESFMLMEDGPKENCMKFCPYCSKPIIQAERPLES